tara:strand:- start:1197 stop:1574 length:378 start_codon:yes stop_codon:yes gene_type:complete
MKKRFNQFLDKNPTVLAYLKDKFETAEERLAYYKQKFEYEYSSSNNFNAFSFGAYKGLPLGIMVGVIAFAATGGVLAAFTGFIGAIGVAGTANIFHDKSVSRAHAHEKTQNELKLESGLKVPGVL